MPPKPQTTGSVRAFNSALAALGEPSCLATGLTDALVASCSLVLGSSERQAIQYFQGTFARHQHTKNPKYNVVSVIFRIATESAMTMHMVVAIARQEMLLSQRASYADVEEDDVALKHYSEALRRVAAFINGNDTETGIDAILATTYLMLTYEQKFGDGNGAALSSHLNGVASIIREKSRRTFMLSAGADHGSNALPTTMALSASTHDSFTPSLFSARMLVWISLLDAGASSTGLGGGINAALHEMLQDHAQCCESCTSNAPGSLFQSYTQLQRYSNPLFPNVWGQDYPVKELMDDIDNHDIFLLYGQCFQLRYMISRLRQLRIEHSTAAIDCQRTIESAFERVREQYGETLLLAGKLGSDVDNSIRAVQNVRFIVPHYHAAILLYSQSGNDIECPEDRHSALTGIMNLAFQAFQHEGDEAMLRIAWPLFMAMLETDDLLHRDWISARLRSLAKYGKNYARAAAFTDFYVAEERRRGIKPDFRDLLQNGDFEQFAI